MYDLEKRIIALEARLNQTIRLGLITSIDVSAGTARVELPDFDGVVSYDLPVLFQKTQDDKYFTMPDIGEQVLCVFLPNGQEQGFILGSMYSQMVTPPVKDPDKTHIQFKDKTSVEYDRKRHKLEIDVKGRVILRASGTVHIIGSTIDLN